MSHQMTMSLSLASGRGIHVRQSLMSHGHSPWLAHAMPHMTLTFVLGALCPSAAATGQPADLQKHEGRDETQVTLCTPAAHPCTLPWQSVWRRPCNVVVLHMPDQKMHAHPCFERTMRPATPLPLSPRVHHVVTSAILLHNRPQGTGLRRSGFRVRTTSADCARRRM